MNKSKISQLLLIKFPIIFPLIYGFILYFFPSLEQLLIIFTILILAETHFGATWPFFLSKTNYPYLKKKKSELILIPILIIVASFFGFIFAKKTFLLIFFIANLYHVTRQSYGVSKLYCKDENEFSFQTNLIYFTNFLLFLIAFFRFYIPIINYEILLFINYVFLLLIFFASIYYIKKFNFSENYLLMITGCIIFYPACFVESPIHIILMGVTMHYTQYLYLTNFVYQSRVQSLNQKDQSNKQSIYYFLFIIIIYSIIMTFFFINGEG